MQTNACLLQPLTCNLIASREFEQQRELRERGLQTDQNSPDESSSGKVSSSEGIINDQIDKVRSFVLFIYQFFHCTP